MLTVRGSLIEGMMRMIRICFGLILLLAASGRMLGQAGDRFDSGDITDGAGAILPMCK